MLLKDSLHILFLEFQMQPIFSSSENISKIKFKEETNETQTMRTLVWIKWNEMQMKIFDQKCWIKFGSSAIHRAIVSSIWVCFVVEPLLLKNIKPNWTEMERNRRKKTHTKSFNCFGYQHKDQPQCDLWYDMMIFNKGTTYTQTNTHSCFFLSPLLFYK